MRRFPRSQRNAGFTLLELLVALTLTAMMTALVTWGIDLGRRAWIATGDRGQFDEIEAGVERLRDIVSKAAPSLELDPQTRIARPAFSGQETSMAFVTLSEGTALESGLVRVHVAWEQGAEVSPCKGAVIVKEGRLEMIRFPGHRQYCSNASNDLRSIILDRPRAASRKNGKLRGRSPSSCRAPCGPRSMSGTRGLSAS